MARPVFIVDGSRTPFLKARSGPGPFTPVDLAVQCGRPLLLRQPFAPDAKARALLDKAARTATRMGHVAAYTASPLLKNQRWYADRQYINGFPANASFTSE